MNIPPLAIIQARYGSSRLPGKVMMTLGDETLVQRAYRVACEAFGVGNVVVAIPCGQPVEFNNHLDEIGAFVAESPARENDVLLRFFHVAHSMRWHPDSVIIRVTPDDWRKDASSLRRVANGERLVVEQGGEAFTLAQLDAAQHAVPYEDLWKREHITYALFDVHPKKPDDDGLPWSIDTQADYDRAEAWVASQ